MNTTKLEAALSDLIEQRNEVIDSFEDAIGSVRALIAKLKASDLGSEPQRVKRRGEAPSYIELAADVIKSAGRPMHINHIVSFVQTARRNDRIKRGSVESALLRHCRDKGTAARVIKVGKGMYGLPQHAQKALALGAGVSAVQ